MPAIICRITFISFLCFSYCMLFANQVENEQIRFSGLSIQDGLSQSTVYSIQQDKKGFIWVATADGLNKYDGYNFTIYQQIKNDSASIQSNLIRALFFDNNDNLWIGTGTGLSFYDQKKNTFRNYVLNSQVNHICQTQPNTLLVATLDGFFKFDIAKKTFFPISMEGKEKPHAQVIAKYSDLIFAGSNAGLYMSPAGSDRFVLLHKELSGKNIMDILPSSKGIWVATEGDGLYFFGNDSKIKRYKHIPNDNKSLSSDYVRCLCYDSQNRLWVGTFVGLNIFNEQSDSFDCYYSNEIDRGSISQNSVRSLFLDNQGAMWVGTFYGGLNYYHPLQNRFGRISHLPFANSLSDNVVSCIVESHPGELWIGTNDNGINVYDVDKKHFTYYTADEYSNGLLLSNNIKAILVNDNHVYIGSHGGGISILNRSTGAFKHFTTQNSLLKSNNVYSFALAPDKKIWVGTLYGLMVFNPQTQMIEPLSENNGSKQTLDKKNIYFLYADSKNRMWIGTETGSFIYSFTDEKLSHYIGNNEASTSRQGEFVNCIMEDNKNRIWIGTSNGLNLFDEEKQSFYTYTTEDGLPNNTVFGILQDSYGRLWLSTNKGLSCFIPETGKFRNYTLMDGIQSDQFNNYSYCKTSNGEMYFGGINGITYFYPESLEDNPFTPHVIITQLNLFNKPVLPGDDTGILEKDISDTSFLELTPSQSSFSLTFTVPNFLSAKHNTFAYKLEPFEKDWNYTSDIRTVSYSFLPHDDYVFSVKAANSDGMWDNTPTVLKIKVLPHWWQTAWARLVFMLLALIIIYVIFRFIRYKESMKNQLNMERLEKEKMEEINQMKLRFFINISHEFRTPLSLIISPIQEMINRITDKWTREQLKIVQRNTNKLLHLVNQLMDYRRAELGVFELKATKKNPTHQVEESMAMFERLAKQKKIDFILENDTDNKQLIYDPHYFELVLNNLLSNAFKFTPEGGKIDVCLYEKDKNFILQISDTGCGLTEEQLKRIFERFYQVNADSIGTGIGLSLVKRLMELHHGKIEVKSEPGKGTDFYIYFPQDKNVYNENEIIDTQNEIVHRSISEEEINLIRMPEENKENPEIDENKPCLLIVEDDTEVRDYLQFNLKEIANIKTASDGEEALKIIKENDINIIITDLMLPVMDGIKLCKAIKQNIRTSHIPIIILTAKTNQQDELEGLAAGADDYVNKPFNLSILKAKVQNMLKAKRRMLEHYSQTLEIDPEKVTFNAMDKELLEKAKNIVERNLNNSEFSVDEFCKEIGMSRSNLHLKLKAITGESTIDFIRKIRFSHACQLLKDGRYSIAEISTMVGFNTPSYFTTSFKKYFGVLPTDYVKEGNL